MRCIGMIFVLPCFGGTSMRIALPVWETLISPVFDTAQHIRIYVAQPSGVSELGEYPLPQESAKKAEFVAANSDVLICGALSRQMEHELAAHGVTVHSWIMGNIETIAAVYAAGNIQDIEYSMPGCRGRHGHGQCSRDIAGNGQGRRGTCRGRRARHATAGIPEAIPRNDDSNLSPDKGE